MDLKKINEVKEGTFLTVNSNPTFYIEVKKIVKTSRKIKVYDKSVHHFPYCGPLHWDEPYEFTRDKFKDEVALTDQDTINKILAAQKSFLEEEERKKKEEEKQIAENKAYWEKKNKEAEERRKEEEANEEYVEMMTKALQPKHPTLLDFLNSRFKSLKSHNEQLKKELEGMHDSLKYLYEKINEKYYPPPKPEPVREVWYDEDGKATVFDENDRSTWPPYYRMWIEYEEGLFDRMRAREIAAIESEHDPWSE